LCRGATRDFNPTLPQKVLDRALERDPAANAAKYLSQFRYDLERFVDRGVVEAAVIARKVRLAIRELPLRMLRDAAAREEENQ
jgi:hypothetical protein